MLKNKTINKIIIKKCVFAEGYKQGIGLMFSIKSHFNYALIFDRKYESKINSAIHMFFVFYSINVLFLNSKKEIVDIKLNLKPFSMYTPKKSRYIIELPIYVALKETKIGHKLSW